MTLEGVNDIKLVVNDEDRLYTPLSPEIEFDQGIKNYIKSKIEIAGYRNNIRLTVISHSAIDEDKFRSAVVKWAQDERSLYHQEAKTLTHMLIGMLILASLFIILGIILVQQSQTFSYTIIPVLGSIALGKAAGICVVDLPINKAKLKMLEKLDKNSPVVFERSESE
ncbi:MAG: hypothetical protein IKE43_10660 [Coriobacteriales bacterium]|nr:hypothetical protein [Coriobacteriales bacterium]